MKLTGLISFITPALAITASYDTVYDSRDTSLVGVACSNGDHGLMKRGYNKFGDLPTFPNIGGTSNIAGWNSPECGTCWNLTYTTQEGEQRMVTITAIDASKNGFNIAEAAMNTLTNGHALDLGVVDVTAVQVLASFCGL